MAALGNPFLYVALVFGVMAVFYQYDEFNPKALRGKRVLITGASSGIGEEVAYAYSKMRAAVMLTARRGDLLQRVAARCRELGAAKAEFFVADMAEADERARLVAATSEQLGGLDHLILNHAIFFFELWTSSEQNVSALGRAMEVNFLSYADIASRAMPLLVASNGSIGVVSSMAGKVPLAYSGFYAPGKFALDGFFSSLRLELDFKRVNVSVTMFVLGFVGTDTAIDIKATKFPNTPLDPALVNETALVIIKGVQLREYDVYYPATEWFFTSLHCIVPRVADYFKLWILSISLPN